MRPVRHHLRGIRDRPDKDDKVKIIEYGRSLIVNLKAVGDHINKEVAKYDAWAQDRKRKHLWYIYCVTCADRYRTFVAKNFWPKEISHKRLKLLYLGLIAREKEREKERTAAKETAATSK